MSLFKRSSPVAAPAGRPPDRRIPTLEPTYFVEIHRDLQASGGTDSVADVARGVANAIENIAHRFLDDLEPRTARSFDKEFGTHALGDLGAADRMIDWLVRWDPVTQETLETLLAKLREVLAKPSTDG